MSQSTSYDPARHYDRITEAWRLLLGDEFHYGLFVTGTEDLKTATAELTRLMIEKSDMRPGLDVLDVGCGIGTQACRLAAEQQLSITGITTSEAGVEASRANARTAGVEHLVNFEQRDGTSNGFRDDTFDRVWALESSHLMEPRGRLLAECARVLRPGGRLALCDIMLRRQMPFAEVRRLLIPLSLLREVFGNAHMERMERYGEMASISGLVVEEQLDLTPQMRPTFDRWRENALRNRRPIAASLDAAGWQRFVDACDVLARFWDDGTLGYGLLTASKV